MRKILSFLLMLICVGTAFTGCVSIQKGSDDRDGRPYVVCTAFPQYDFVKNIAGEHVKLEMLVPAGTDTHNFGLKDLSISKLNRLNGADLLLSVGGESDEKLVSELKTTLKGSTQFLSLLSLVKEPLLTSDDHGHTHDDGHDHTSEYDEHVWTSPKRAMELTEALCGKLAELDPANKEVYQAGAKAYLDKLSRLDAEFEALKSARKYDTLIFADRYPFRYLCHDYGIAAEAAFSGCSSEVEPSLSVLDALYEKAAALGLPAILYMEGSTPAYAESIAKKIGAKAMLLHSCHVLTDGEMENQDYLSLMQKNLSVLKTALGVEN